MDFVVSVRWTCDSRSCSLSLRLCECESERAIVPSQTLLDSSAHLRGVSISAAFPSPLILVVMLPRLRVPWVPSPSFRPAQATTRTGVQIYWVSSRRTITISRLPHLPSQPQSLLQHVIHLHSHIALLNPLLLPSTITTTTRLNNPPLPHPPHLHLLPLPLPRLT